jgi:hypothetical protein
MRSRKRRHELDGLALVVDDQGANQERVPVRHV